MQDKLLDHITALVGTEFKTMQLGLDRVQDAIKKLQLYPSARVITVAGTNGKGTTVACIDAIAGSHDIKTVCFTSPHIHKVNERIKLNSIAYSETILKKFATAIANSLNQQDIKVTFFEFIFLLALYVIKKENPELIILEVGLGGEFDATNAIDADLAIITSIGFDHMHILGHTIAQIAKAKAGIIKPNAILVCQDIGKKAKQVILSRANKLKAQSNVFTEDYNIIFNEKTKWCYKDKKTTISEIESLGFPMANAASAIFAFRLISKKFVKEKVRNAINLISVPGRFEKITYKNKLFILDVAHNKDSVLNLANKISNMNTTFSVIFAQLKTKDLETNVEPFLNLASQWYLPKLDIENITSNFEINKYLIKKVRNITCTNSISSCIKSSLLDENNVILVYGSFYTVAAVRAFLLKNK